MLDHRMLIIDLLNRHRGDSSRRSGKVRTIKHALAARRGGLARGHRPNRANRGLTNGGSLNRSASHRGDPFDRNAAIDDSGLVDGIIVNNRGFIVNASDLGARQAVRAQVAFTKIMDADESKVIHMKPEIEIHADVQAIEEPAGSGLKDRMRRQGRPAAIIS